MNIKKRGMLLIFAIFLIFNSYGIYASLGLTPALMEVDFEPGAKFLVNFQVLGASSNQKLIVYAEGDFSEYVTFDKTNLTGQEGFTAYINLPEKAEKPGKNRLYIKVKEFEEETEGIRTIVVIGALISIKVPYPGKYAEIKSFDVNDVNAGEPVNFAVEVESLGKEDIIVAVDIEVYSDEEIIDKFSLGGGIIKHQTSKIFEKTLDKGYEPGVYNATAIVDYGLKIKTEKVFRVGKLFVEIVNWSSEFKKGKINEFDIDIESKWNNNIKNVYAGVNITKNEKEVDYFKTPSVDLDRWGKSKLKGFFNAENLDEGDYKAKIILFYEGEKTEKVVDIKIVKITNKLVIGLIIGVIVLTIIIVIAVIYIILKKKKSRKKRE